MSNLENQHARDSTQLKLADFFPYQLSILNDEVSRSVAEVYESRFALTRQQWRILATLGGAKELTAKSIGQRTRMEKMPVSRAATQLEDKNLIARRRAEQDRRNHYFSLTREGRLLYETIVPRVLAREAYILSILSKQERKVLEAAMAKLGSRARELHELG